MSARGPRRKGGQGGCLRSEASPPDRKTGRWKIYKITEKTSRRQYVGVTSRTIEARYVAHRHDAYRGTPRRAGGLADAILRSGAAGIPYATAFSVDLLDACDDPVSARQLEFEWIARLDTMQPSGMNSMPGGSSLGGPSNAMPVTLEHPIRGRIEYPSRSDAILDINAERVRAGLTELGVWTVLARFKAGWSPEEALELVTHKDGRRVRVPYIYGAQEFDTLADASKASGLPLETLRSRLWRARNARHGAPTDSSSDRRRSGPDRSPVVTCYGINVPAPAGHGDGLVTLETFARLAGLPKATVQYRYERPRREGIDARTMDPDDLRAVLTSFDDRRIVLELQISDDEVWVGGVRELIRRLFDDHVMECRRVERIGDSAIRARLRRISGWPRSLEPAQVRWAFGFESD